jgi:CubicO group peptidase (beta-lactamase class C family)
MASFASEVAKLADRGDQVAAAILERAGRLLAAALDAALGDDLPERAGFVGGLSSLGEALTGPFKTELARLRPNARLEAKPRPPLEGALLLARRLAGPDPVREHAPLLLVHRRRRSMLASVSAQELSPASQLAVALRLAASARPHPAFSGARLSVAWDGKVEVDLAVGVEQRFADASGSSTPPGARRSVTTATAFDLASLTKVYVALSLGELVERAGESIDAPIGRFLPVAEAASHVTIAQLLGHTSGLPAAWHGWQTESGADGYWAQIFALEPVAEPGSAFGYSCVNYLLAGALAERLAAAPLDHVVSEVLLTPMGLTRTAFKPPPDWPVAATEDRDQPAWAPRGMIRGEVHDEAAWSLGGVAGNAGLFATGADVLAVAEMIRSGGVHGTTRILDARVVERACGDQLPPAVKKGAGFGHGLGLRVADRTWMGPLAETGAVGHTGFTGTAMLIDNSRGLTCVLLTNGVHPNRMWSDRNEIRLAVADVLSRW